MKFKILVAGIILLNLFSFSKGQQSIKDYPVFDEFEFFYVDNSRIKGRGGLDGALIELMGNKIDSLRLDSTSNKKFLIYISNGDDPLVSNNLDEVERIINILYVRNFDRISSRLTENRLVSKTICEVPFMVRKRINFHFFVTDLYVQTLINAPPFYVLSLLPKYICDQLSLDDCLVNVIVYINNREKNIDTANFDKVLDFFDSNVVKRGNCQILYRIIENSN